MLESDVNVDQYFIKEYPVTTLFFYFPQKNWPYNLRDMNIIWQTMFTTGSNEARGLGHSQETMRKTNPPSCHMASQKILHPLPIKIIKIKCPFSDLTSLVMSLFENS